MGENVGSKQPIMRILFIGLAILLISILVCVGQTSVLRDAYVEHVEMDYCDSHVESGMVIDNVVYQVNTDVKGLGDSICAGNFDEELIFLLLDSYVKGGKVDSAAFYDTSEEAYYMGDKVPGDAVAMKLGYDNYVQQFPKSRNSMFTGIIKKTDGTCYLVCEMPVYLVTSYKGYVVTTIDITELFGAELYEYRGAMCENYLVDGKGNIKVEGKSHNIVPEDEMNIFTALANYMVESRKNDETIRELPENMLNNPSGYAILKNKEGYEIEIAYSKLNGLEDTYYISCYNANVAQEDAMPLLFKTVLSCMIIIFLMLIIIVFVWVMSKKANITIEKLAYEDPVTKGKNINFFKEFAINVMSVFKETPFVLYRFDIANFRYINEAYGHTKADAVLGACISSFVNIFSDKELCVRMDSDQFLALIVNDQDCEQRIKQYVDAVNEYARGSGIKYPIKFKMGVYQVRKHDHDIDVMIDHANVARKTLKGDDKVMKSIYSDKVVTDMRKIDRIESEMQHALATEEFKVFYQPKWDIASNTICGAEALVRWIKSDGTMVYPDEFIPVFENNGFIEKLDFYMLEKVCSEMHDAIAAKGTVYPVSVNQSRILLYNRDYVSNVEKVVRKYDIPAGYIELEITETVFENEKMMMMDTLNALKKCGVRLAMDDFGSGYSSLNMLKEVPLDIIKIDREFFSESITSENSLWILQKIIEMVNGLGLEIVCEGVETENQSSLLRQIGCRIVQGYLYSKPISSEEYQRKYCIKDR